MSEIRSQATPADGSLETEHYQLFNLIENTISAVIESAGPEDEYWEAASAVLKAGWSRPRTVNSATELDALPHGTLIRDVVDRVGEIETAISGNRVVFWIGNECEDDLEDITLPVTVLFTPGGAG